MAELFIKQSSVGFIKAIIFDKDGTLSNSEEYLLELAKIRIKFLENKFKKLKINNIKIWLLRNLLASVYGLKKKFSFTKCKFSNCFKGSKYYIFSNNIHFIWL